MRSFGMAISAGTVLFFCACSGCGMGGPSVYVDPFIGTGEHGHTYPGATLPFGMVQLSPDTRLEGWDGCSGYHYSDEFIYGFSHTHLSGTGIADYCDVLLMPTVGEVRLHNGADGEPGYRSAFRHSTERASPGYYSVLLDDYRVGVELTTTLRAGLHRYKFPETGEANVIVDLEHRDPVVESTISFVGDSEIEGYRRSRSWASDQRVYFIARFSRPFASFGIAQDDVGSEGAREAAGRNLKAWVSFATSPNEEVLVKVGISAVSVEGARRNLEAEIPGWDFNSVRTEAKRAWNEELGRIEVEGGSRKQRTVFYTALYHSFLAPNLYMDVDGRYRGRDMEVHRAEDFTNHTVFSLWDTFRAAHPLYTLIQQARTVDMLKTFLAQYEQGGLLPVWELSANETNTMIGYHAIPVIADAWIKGIRDFDINKAFEAMKASAATDLEGLDHYRERGYISGDEEGASVSSLLEYAYDDWCIAQVAKELGREEDYQQFIRRAQYYKNIFDPSTGFMRPKISGRWLEPFDPREVNFHFTEANSWQYSFFVPHDVEGLIGLLGGPEAFVEQLDRLFTETTETTGQRQSDITGLIGQYAHGNEPSHHMAYLYSYAGVPWKTQERVREIMDTLYLDTPEGLSGNEDCGQMSAWFVLSALGFYPVCPGRPEYVIGTPLFPKATIHLENGNRFVIEARDVSGKNIYIQSADLNGQPLARTFISHDEILEGGELVFRMGPVPDSDWGVAGDEVPRSSVTEHLITPVPYVASGARSFRGSTEVSLGVPDGEGDIHYTLDGSIPTTRSRRYVAPFMINGNTTLRAIAVNEGMPPSHAITALFSRMPDDMSLTLNTDYAPRYPAGGDMALIDQIRGSTNFRTGTWQGYYGVDLDAVVDLGGEKAIRELRAGFLQEQRSWVWLPREVEYALSSDMENFRVVGTVENDVSERRGGALVRDFVLNLSGERARFVRVRAKNRGTCPDWHSGAGNPAWIFADEIIVR